MPKRLKDATAVDKVNLCKTCALKYERYQDNLMQQLADKYGLDVNELTETQLKFKVNR